ncbi:MAG TPA: putative quinol monooxygenase [Pyrinomonadaceae bacterium]|nr:putative quinol monooxygenase [Pyrinomonadaceae bacterium]
MKTDDTIVLFARLKVKKNAVEEARKAALGIIAVSRAEAGCINYDFHQSIEDETLFLWHETWTNREAIETHGNSSHFKEFSRAIKDFTEEPLQVTLTKMVSEKAR